MQCGGKDIRLPRVMSDLSSVPPCEGQNSLVSASPGVQKPVGEGAEGALCETSGNAVAESPSVPSDASLVVKRHIEHVVPGPTEKKARTSGDDTSIPCDRENLKKTRVAVTGLGFYVHSFVTQPACGAEATLKPYKCRGEPAVAVLVGGVKHGSIKKEHVDLVMRTLDEGAFIRACFPKEHAHIRHRSLDLVELS